MSKQIAALTAAFLISASPSDAQTPFGYGSEAVQICAPQQNDFARKQAELVKVQTKISNLTEAIAVLREGITMQQQIASDGKQDAALAGVFGFAKVPKAVSDTFLTIAQPVAPHVKKAYDAADALVSAGYALVDRRGLQVSAGALDALEAAADAHIAYLKGYKGEVIRPARMQTPGVLSSSIKGADALGRGDLAGAASHLASGTGKLLDPAAKNGKSGLRIVSDVAAMVSDTPGKTDESRFANGLSAMSEVGKMAARAAGDRQAYAVARMASSTGRVLGYSGVMLEQVGNVKQGLADTAVMVEEYKAIDERSTSTQKKMQRQIDSKLEEIEKLRVKEYELQVAISQAASSSQDCRQPEAGQVAAGARASQPAPGQVAAGVRASQPPATRTPYVWDRTASRDRLERARQVRAIADARKAPAANGGYAYAAPELSLGTPTAGNSRPPSTPAVQGPTGQVPRCSGCAGRAD